MTYLIAANSDDRVLPIEARAYTDGLLASWWSGPRAVEVDGRTFAGGTSPIVIDGYGPGVDPVPLWLAAQGDPSLILDPGGLVAVVELGVPRRHVIRRARHPDDHCTPAILIPDDRPPILFGGPRADDAVPYRRGTNPGDITDMGPLEGIDVTAEGGNASYQQAFRTPGTDTITLLTRTTQRWWTVCRSTDWGDTWTTHRLIDYGPNQGYLLATQNGDRLRCVAYSHPNHNLPQMRALDIDLTSGDIAAADGTPLGNLDGTGLPIAVETIPVTWDPPTGHRTRLLDVSTTGEILLAVWPDGDDDSALYRHLRPVGGTWIETDLGPSGPAIGWGTGANYIGGAVFPNPSDGSVWLARNDGLGEWIDQWSRVGDTWTIEHWTRTDDTWTHAETVATDTVPLCRPVCPVGATIGPAVIWHRVALYGHPVIWVDDYLDWHPRTP